ncbi:unnamed protein product [Closterium sp. NIES-65]|nr:unnamed protein product [Closterium sp. NIES-65]
MKGSNPASITGCSSTRLPQSCGAIESSTWQGNQFRDDDTRTSMKASFIVSTLLSLRCRCERVGEAPDGNDDLIEWLYTAYIYMAMLDYLVPSDLPSPPSSHPLPSPLTNADDLIECPLTNADDLIEWLETAYVYMATLDYPVPSDFLILPLQHDFPSLFPPSIFLSSSSLTDAEVLIACPLTDADDLISWLETAYIYMAMVDYQCPLISSCHCPPTPFESCVDEWTVSSQVLTFSIASMPGCAGALTPSPQVLIFSIASLPGVGEYLQLLSCVGELTGLPASASLIDRIVAGVGVYYNYSGSESCFSVGDTDPHDMSNGWDFQNGCVGLPPSADPQGMENGVWDCPQVLTPKYGSLPSCPPTGAYDMTCPMGGYFQCPPTGAYDMTCPMGGTSRYGEWVVWDCPPSADPQGMEDGCVGLPPSADPQGMENGCVGLPPSADPQGMENGCVGLPPSADPQGMENGCVGLPPSADPQGMENGCVGLPPSADPKCPPTGAYDMTCPNGWDFPGMENGCVGLPPSAEPQGMENGCVWDCPQVLTPRYGEWVCGDCPQVLTPKVWRMGVWDCPQVLTPQGMENGCVGLPPSADPQGMENGCVGLPPSADPKTAFEEHCLQQYGVAPRPTWTMTQIGRQSIRSALRHFGSNIVFSQGRFDPGVEAVGPLHAILIRSSPPYCYPPSLFPSSLLPLSLFPASPPLLLSPLPPFHLSHLHNQSAHHLALRASTPDGAHHLDLRASTPDDPASVRKQRKEKKHIQKRPPPGPACVHPADPPSVRKQRKEEKKHIQKWIKQLHKDREEAKKQGRNGLPRSLPSIISSSLFHPPFSLPHCSSLPSFEDVSSTSLALFILSLTLLATSVGLSFSTTRRAAPSAPATHPHCITRSLGGDSDTVIH